MAYKRMLLNTAIYSIGEIFPKLVSFFLLPVFTSYLSSTDYGIISYTNSLVLFLMVLSALSLNTFLLREYFDCPDENGKKRLIGNIFYSILFFNVVILLASYLAGPFIAAKANLKIPFFPYFSLTLLSNFFESFAIIPLVIFRVQQQAKYYVVTNIVKSALIFLLTYILIVYCQWGIMGNYYGRLIINGIFVIPYFYIVIRNSVPVIDLRQLKQGLKFSLPLLPGAISYLLMGISDRLILERFLPLSQIGIYSVAYTLALSLTIVVQSGYKAIEPEIYTEYKKENFQFVLGSIHRVFMFAVFACGALISLFSKEILIVMTTGDFVNGYIITPLILIGIIVSAQNMILSSLAIAEKKPKIITLSTILGGVTSVGLNVSLIPRFGIVASAVTSAIAFIVMNLVIQRTLTVKHRFSVYDLPAMGLFLLLYVFILFYPVHQLSFFTLGLKLSIWIIFTIILLLIYKLDIKQFKSYLRLK